MKGLKYLSQYLSSYAYAVMHNTYAAISMQICEFMKTATHTTSKLCKTAMSQGTDLEKTIYLSSSYHQRGCIATFSRKSLLLIKLQSPVWSDPIYIIRDPESKLHQMHLLITRDCKNQTQETAFYSTHTSVIHIYFCMPSAMVFRKMRCTKSLNTFNTVASVAEVYLGIHTIQQQQIAR